MPWNEMGRICQPLIATIRHIPSPIIITIILFAEDEVNIVE